MLQAGATLFLERRQSAISNLTIDMHNEVIFLKGKLIDHLLWRSDLLESAVTGKKFAGQTDYTKCGFGKWYYEYKKSPEYRALDDDRKRILDSMEQPHTSMHVSAVKINRAGSVREATAIYDNETKPAASSLLAVFNRYIDSLDVLMETNEERMHRYGKVMSYVNIISVIVVILVSLVVSIVIIRIVMRSFSLFRNGFDQVSSGDLTTRIDDSTGDEFGALAAVFNSFVGRIRGIVTEILDMSSQIAASSEELSTASLSFSENSQNQAASAEEVTATIEEISAGMDGVANGARQQSVKLENLIRIRDELSHNVLQMRERVHNALKVSETISSNARAGEGSLADMDASMKKISASSGEVTNIVKIINDISEQINLLSLNAAIEAARAGESGRGFAVVADEISKLADQTATSIKDIDRLIRANEGEIRNGQVNVSTTVAVISDIINGVSEIGEMMRSINEGMRQQVDINTKANDEMAAVQQRSDEIKSASEEQKIAIEEIVKSISNINHVTQATASGAEEMTANAEELAGMADRLKSRVDYFKVD